MSCLSSKIFRLGKRCAKYALLICFCTACYTLLAYATDNFSCYVVDQQGCRIDSYYAVQDDTYYIFLTSCENISDVVVHFNDTITAASSGELDTEAHTLNGAFLQSGDSVTLTDVSGGGTYTVCVMQSSLPSLYITLSDATLGQVHNNGKDQKYENTQVVLSDPTHTYDTIRDANATFKGRGNSSWNFYEKKGYQLKFDKKTSVLGMPKAKKWVLLANAGDDSMLRNYLAFELARKLELVDAPECQFVDLWVDGDYRGTYLISEKVEIGEGRVNLTDPLGAVFEYDEAFYQDEDIWFVYERLGHFTLKDSCSEGSGSINAAIDNFNHSLDGLFKLLESNNFEDITLEQLRAWIDIDSVAGYYLVNEFLCNAESIISSFYWYQDGLSDMIHLGPVWDFDSAMGIVDYDYYIYRRYIFDQMLSCKAFGDYVNQLYREHDSLFAALETRCSQMAGYLSETANMNYIRWDCLGQTHVKGVYKDTYAAAVSDLGGWLAERYNVFEVYSPPCLVKLSSDATKLIVTYHGDRAWEDVRFPVWSAENGQDDLVWYAGRRGDGYTWYCEVPMAEHGSKGFYLTHVYARGGNDSWNVVAVGSGFVDTLVPAEAEPANGESGRSSQQTNSGREKYSLSFEPNGGAGFQPITQYNGTTVDLSRFIPIREGYSFEGWCTDVELTMAVAEIELTENITVYAKWIKDNESTPNLQYWDVKEGMWYYGAICYCDESGYFGGVAKNRFDPSGTMTRAMFATVLYRMAGMPEVTSTLQFRDVRSGTWYTDAIVWATANGYIDGYGDGTYGPADPITRAQMVTMLWRFDGKEHTKENKLSVFSDVNEISAYARDAFAWAVDKGIISGRGQGLLDPKGTATRAEVAQMVMNYAVG